MNNKAIELFPNLLYCRCSGHLLTCGNKCQDGLLCLKLGCEYYILQLLSVCKCIYINILPHITLD